MLTRTKFLISISCAFLLATWLFCAHAGAQQTSTITGTVTDPTGAVVPGATITVQNEANGATSTTTSNGDGLFTLPGLGVGSYNMSVTAERFESYKKTNIVVNAAQTVEANVTLVLGTVSQTVTVQAAALQVQQESNEVSTLISGQQVRNIATNGRNITSLMTLGTGVSGNLPSFNGVTAQNSTATISFNGMRPDQNNFVVDGGEVYDRGSGGKLDVLPSPNSIAEFQLLASNYPPDYGISSGATVLVELKSGSQKYHGQLWEFDRNDVLDAAYYFFKQAHQASPELRLNIFGGNVGGPVWLPHIWDGRKHQTFFFVNEEWRRYIQGANPSVTSTVPLADFPTAGAPLTYVPWNAAAPVVPVTTDPAKLALYATDKLTPGSPFPGNVIPANLMDPNAVLMMNSGAIPKPNDGTDNYIASPKQPTYVREDVVRGDQSFGSKYHLMGSWIHDAMSQTIFPTQWSGDSYTTVGDVFANPSWGAAVRLTQSLSPTILNETGFYANGNHIHVTPAGTYAEPSGWSAGSFFANNNPDNRMPQVAFSGSPLNTTWTVIYWPWNNSYLDYQIRDDINVTRGKHAMRFGVQYMREDKNQQLQADTEGDFGFNGAQFSGDSYVNFLLGFASTYSQLQAQRTDHWLTNNYSFYAMDNWHVLPRLTLNLGFRYDLLPHTYEKNNQVSNFVPAYYSAASAQTPNATTGDLNPAGSGFVTYNGQAFYVDGLKAAGSNGFPRGLVKNDYFTLQPRLGFAYDLFGKGETVLRGGIGIFYNRVQGNDIYNLDTNAPFSYQPSVNDVYFSTPQVNDLTGATATVPAGPASITNMNYYYPNPANAQYSLGIQHQFAPSVIMAIQYVGSEGWDQDDLREINDLPLAALPQREAVATACKGYVTPTGTTATTCPNPNSNLYRGYQGWGNIRQEENATNFNYNSLQAALRTSSWHRFTAQFAYTYSHEIDIASSDLTTQNLSGASNGTVSNPYNLKYDRGSGLYDRRHIFNANYIYALPALNNSNGLTRTTIGGWTIAGVTVAETGSPQNIYYNGPDVLGLGGNATTRPNIVAPVRFPKTQNQWFTTSSFAAPVAPWLGGANNGFGDAGKDTIVQPGLFNWNLSLYKSFLFTRNAEGPRLELRADSFNTFNHTEFNDIDTGTTDTNYGKATSTYDPRELQFGATISF